MSLALWDNIANDGLDGGTFSGPAPKFTSPGAVPTVHAAPNLHVCVATLEIPEPELLLPAHIYSYNVTFTTAVSAHDLKSEGLLQDNLFDIEGRPVTERGHVHAARGYGKGDLPSFAMPPTAPRSPGSASASSRGLVKGRAG